MQPNARTVGRIQLPAIAAPLERKTYSVNSTQPSTPCLWEENSERPHLIFMYFAYVYCSVMLRSNYGMSLIRRTLAASVLSQKIANNLNSILQGEGGGGRICKTGSKTIIIFLFESLEVFG